MAIRLGIELTPTACRIVELDGAAHGGHDRETRVVSYAVLPASGPETATKLASLRGRRAAVVVWTGGSEHRQAMVPWGSYESMRKAALKVLGAAGVRTRGMWTDIAPTRATHDGRRRPVIVSLAPADAMKAALQPLVDAGVRIRTVMTPADALGSLAHLRHRPQHAGAVEAFIAIEETVTCVALARDGMLIAARDLAWGFMDEIDGRRERRRREDIAARLVDELAELFDSVSGAGVGAVSQATFCGGLDELRSITVPLIARLDVEVETLDSLAGIDAANLPEPSAEFHERVAALRLAWAAVADAPAGINLMRARRRQESSNAFKRAAIAAGVAAGLGFGWLLEQSPLIEGRSAPIKRTVAARQRTPPPAMPSAIAKPVTLQPAPTTAAPWLAARTLPAVGGLPQSLLSNLQLASIEPAAPVASPPLAVPPPPVTLHAGEPAAEPAVIAAASRIAVRQAMARSQPEPSPMTAVRPRPSVPATTTAARVTTPLAPSREQALPFDAVLGSILYSADRRLAIVDGQIVGVGDEVHDARVVEITPVGVLFRDEQGRLRRLSLGAGGR